MATIRISRKDEFLGRFKNFDLYVDGKKVVQIPHGGCSCISLDSGAHILEAKSNWCSSSHFKIQLNPNDFVNLNLACHFFRKVFVFSIFTCLSILFTFSNMAPATQIFLLTLMVVFFYHQVIFRKKCIEIKTENLRH
jgi:hypothetical protein